MAADAKDLLIRELKDSVSEQRQMNKTLRAALENSNNQVAELTIQIQLLNEQLEYMKRKLFGRSSEKHAAEIDGQLTLFDEPEKEEPAILPAAEIPVKSHVRKPKATFEEKTKNLPVERIEVPLPEEDQFCPVCGTHLEVIGKEVVRKELEYIPATLKVVEYVSIHYEVRSANRTQRNRISYILLSRHHCLAVTLPLQRLHGLFIKNMLTDFHCTVRKKTGSSMDLP